MPFSQFYCELKLLLKNKIFKKRKNKVTHSNDGSLIATHAPFLCKMLIAGEAVYGGGGRGMWESLYLPLNFSVNLKLLLKIKSIK